MYPELTQPIQSLLQGQVVGKSIPYGRSRPERHKGYPVLKKSQAHNPHLDFTSSRTSSSRQLAGPAVPSSTTALAGTSRRGLHGLRLEPPCGLYRSSPINQWIQRWGWDQKITGPPGAAQTLHTHPPSHTSRAPTLPGKVLRVVE